MSDLKDSLEKSSGSKPGYTNSWPPLNDNNKKPATIKGDFSAKYPYRWTDKFFEELQFDEQEIPYSNMPGLTRLAYDPTLIAAYGLHNHNQFLLDGEIRRRYTALHMADWLVGNLQEWQGLFFAWPIDYNEPFYQISPPWISCQTQGLAISLLLRVAFLNNDASYEDTVHKAAKLFFVTQDKGGLVSRFEDGGLAFETFPGKVPTLNFVGNLFAIIGIYELAHYFQSRTHETIFSSAINSLINNLNRYEHAPFLLKDLHPSQRIASKFEVDTITNLLFVLGKLCEEDELLAFAKKWQTNYTNNMHAMRYLINTKWDAFRFRNVYKKK